MNGVGLGRKEAPRAAYGTGLTEALLRSARSQSHPAQTQCRASQAPRGGSIGATYHLDGALPPTPCTARASRLRRPPPPVRPPGRCCQPAAGPRAQARRHSAAPWSPWAGCSPGGREGDTSQALACGGGDTTAGHGDLSGTAAPLECKQRPSPWWTRPGRPGSRAVAPYPSSTISMAPQPCQVAAS